MSMTKMAETRTPILPSKSLVKVQAGWVDVAAAAAEEVAATAVLPACRATRPATW